MREPAPPSRADVHAILAVVAARRGVDFRDHREERTVQAIERRMALTGAPDAASYARLLEEAPGEVARLVEAIVVPVTGFFRDPAVFAALETRVVPRLLARIPPGRPLRAWVAGASTGEEAWSLAMVLASTSEPAGRAWEILATDIDARSLETARRGWYPLGAAADVPAVHRDRWLVPEASGVRLSDRLAAGLRFSLHDVTGPDLAPADAVVAAFDLVLLRNVLIYLERRLQDKTLSRLCATLLPGGVLVLGEVEEPSPALAGALIPHPGIDPALSIYARRDG